MLGRFHTVTEVIHRGHQRGRDLGFPTANLGPEPAVLVPADGVYAGHLTVVEQQPDHAGVAQQTGDRVPISIVPNPTFTVAGRPRRTGEAYVHDVHDVELYVDTLHLAFVDFERPTVKSHSAEAVVEH